MSAPFPKNMGVLSGFVYAEGNHVSPLGSFPLFRNLLTMGRTGRRQRKFTALKHDF